MNIKIGVAGIAGRMGLALAQEVKAAKAVLSGGTSRSGDGPDGVVLFNDISDLAAVSDVVIDFTHASLVAGHARAMQAAGKKWVLGTTGYDADDRQAIEAAATAIAVVVAANFSPGVNLLLALAAQLGAALPAAQYDAEILEMHHRQKLDAPSGTALALGRAVAAGRGVALEDVMTSGRDGLGGPRPEGEIGFAALRGGQIIGTHSVILTAASEQITLTHLAFDRRVFAAGAVRAAVWLAGRPAGLYGMKDVLGI